MKIDRARLAADIKNNEQRIRLLKAILRESGQPRIESWATPDGEIVPAFTKGAQPFRCYLERFQAQATLLCSIAAHARKRVHAKGSDLEQQAVFIGSLWVEYERKEEKMVA